MSLVLNYLSYNRGHVVHSSCCDPQTDLDSQTIESPRTSQICGQEVEDSESVSSRSVSEPMQRAQGLSTFQIAFNVASLTVAHCDCECMSECE